MFTVSDPYRVLGVAPTAGADEIRTAYLKLLRAHPPEKEPERFKAIRAAYEKLKDETQRIRTAVMHMDLSDTGPPLLFPEAASPPPVFDQSDLWDIILAAGEFQRRDFPEDLTDITDEEVMGNDD